MALSKIQSGLLDTNSVDATALSSGAIVSGDLPVGSILQVAHVTGGTAPTYSHVLNVGYNDTFDSAIKDCYVSGFELQMIPTGITQSNYGGVLSTGYLGISGTYLTT